MNILTLIPIIAQYGVPFAEYIYTIWKERGEPTAADWQKLNDLASQTSQSKMVDALTRAGIAVDSEQGKAFLALVQHNP